MIFNQFDPTDIVSGRTNLVSSGFFPNAAPAASQSLFTDNFWALTQSAVTPSPSYGSSIYDIRETMYYVNVYPDSTSAANNDSYFSIAYGNFYGEYGSGSFNLETASILANPTKAVYSQYINLLVGGDTLVTQFQMNSGSTSNLSVITANDIFVIDFSSYKMKDGIVEGLFEITLSGSLGSITLRDDSPFLAQASSVYNLITGSINSPATTLPPYQGIGLLYPDDGVVIFNASVVNQLIGLNNLTSYGGPFNYNTAPIPNVNINGVSVGFTVNHEVFSWAIGNASNATMKVGNNEYVPSQYYFVRVKNQEFNYSNNPTYVWDGLTANSNGIVYPAGTIYNSDFITNPTTYITTIGLYDNNNNLVAVAKLSHPTVKTFDNELLVKVRSRFLTLYYYENLIFSYLYTRC